VFVPGYIEKKEEEISLLKVGAFIVSGSSLMFVI
jgi:hypothetical protein